MIARLPTLFLLGTLLLPTRAAAWDGAPKGWRGASTGSIVCATAAGVMVGGTTLAFAFGEPIPRRLQKNDAFDLQPEFALVALGGYLASAAATVFVVPYTAVRLHVAGRGAFPPDRFRMNGTLVSFAVMPVALGAALVAPFHLHYGNPSWLGVFGASLFTVTLATRVELGAIRRARTAASSEPAIAPPPDPPTAPTP